MAVLTAGYSAGQILGPPAVTPLLRHGYHQALLLAAAVVLAAAAAAAVLRVGFARTIPGTRAASRAHTSHTGVPQEASAPTAS